LEYLLTDIDETGILTITINQPKRLNALSGPLMKELGTAMDDALANDSVKSIILTGAGDKAFVAGADISEFQTLSADKAVAKSKDGMELFRKIETSSKQVIAAVNGFALGGGCELAMSCHMRTASENAKFGQPEVNLGIIPGYGGTQRLANLVGRGRANELLMTADMIDAQRAYEIGLVNHVFSSEELMEKTKKILGKINAKSPLTIAQIVKCVDANYDKNADGYDVEAQEFGNCFNTEDFTEGVTAFLEKRKANFTGK